jgi:hypothetical protein
MMALKINKKYVFNYLILRQLKIFFKIPQELKKARRRKNTSSQAIQWPILPLPSKKSV